MDFLTKIIEGVSTKKKVKEVKHFHPEGKKLPNGSLFQKGGFMTECMKNRDSFSTFNNQYFLNEKFDFVEVKEAIHGEQYGLNDYIGGIIVFSTEVNALEVSDSKVKNWIGSKIKSIKQRLFSKSMLSKLVQKFNAETGKEWSGTSIEDYIGAFSIGNFFNGRYLGDNGEIYNEKSTSIEVNGISSEGLIYLAEEIAREFHQETVLVKDLNKNKIFLVNGDEVKSDEPQKPMTQRKTSNYID